MKNDFSSSKLKLTLPTVTRTIFFEARKFYDFLAFQFFYSTLLHNHFLNRPPILIFYFQ
jgi:hypothetical protein